MDCRNYVRLMLPVYLQFRSNTQQAQKKILRNLLMLLFSRTAVTFICIVWLWDKLIWEYLIKNIHLGHIISYAAVQSKQKDIYHVFLIVFITV